MKQDFHNLGTSRRAGHLQSCTQAEGRGARATARPCACGRFWRGVVWRDVRPSRSPPRFCIAPRRQHRPGAGAFAGGAVRAADGGGGGGRADRQPADGPASGRDPPARIRGQYGDAGRPCGRGHGRDRHGDSVAGHDDAVSGRARSGIPLAAAAGLSGLCAGLCLYHAAVASRPRPAGAARCDGMGAERLLVPRHPVAARRSADADLRALPLRLPAGAGAVPQPVDQCMGGGAHAGAGPLGHVPPGEPADGMACHRGRRAAGGDGDHRRRGHRLSFRGADLCHRHLSGVVLDGGPGGGGTAGAVPADRGPCACAGRAGDARARAVPQRGPPV